MLPTAWSGRTAVQARTLPSALARVFASRGKILKSSDRGAKVRSLSAAKTISWTRWGVVQGGGGRAEERLLDGPGAMDGVGLDRPELGGCAAMV